MKFAGGGVQPPRSALHDDQLFRRYDTVVMPGAFHSRRTGSGAATVLDQPHGHAARMCAIHRCHASSLSEVTGSAACYDTVVNRAGCLHSHRGPHRVGSRSRRRQGLPRRCWRPSLPSRSPRPTTPGSPHAHWRRRPEHGRDFPQGGRLLSGGRRRRSWNPRRSPTATSPVFASLLASMPRSSPEFVRPGELPPLSALSLL